MTGLRPPRAPSGSSPGRGFLTPAILRDVADLNQQFLGLSLEPALAADPRYALPETARAALRSGGTELLERVAACPFTLFEVSLVHDGCGGADVGPRVEDSKRPLVDAATAARAHSFGDVAVFLAWRLADAEPLAVRIVLGLSAAAELLLSQVRPTDLPRLANAPHLIRPRWTQHPRFWNLLLRASAAPGQATLQRAHCAGICMIVADLYGPDGQPRDALRRQRR